MNFTTTLKKNLTIEELGEVKAFSSSISVKKGVVYKLDVYTLTPEPNDFGFHVLYRKGDALLGYASVNTFGDAEVEATIISENEISLNNIFVALSDDLKGVNKDLLIIANTNDEMLTEWLKSTNSVFINTEYRMMFDYREYNSPDIDGLLIHAATPEDSEIIMELDMAAFGLRTGKAPSTRDLLNTRIAYRDGKPIGKLRVDAYDGVFGIYGLAVIPEYRGKGIGKAFLGGFLNDLIAIGYEKIYLEVEVNNDRAIRLYKSLGFHTEAVFDYYRIVLNNKHRVGERYDLS